MLENLGNKLIFPAPVPSYTATSYKRHLCWIPWSRVISPSKAAEREDGIPCLWFPAPKAATVLLFFHANAEDLGMCFQVLKHMRDQFKVNILSVEYPGYGLLQDLAPSEDGVYEVALTALRFVVDEIGVRYSQIILFGRSLGSGPAVYLAARYPVGGLVLVSPFSSIKGAVQSIVGQVFAWSITERFPNLKVISNVSCPVLFIHGESDSLIPAEHSLRLFKRCRARKLLVTPPKMEHNSNLFSDASFLAVPAIHFFGFPGYYTSTPPRLPGRLFEIPRPAGPSLRERAQERSGCRAWMCDCLAKGDVPQLEVNFRRQEQSGDEFAMGLLKEEPLAGDHSPFPEAKDEAYSVTAGVWPRQGCEAGPRELPALWEAEPPLEAEGSLDAPRPADGGARGGQEGPPDVAAEPPAAGLPGADATRPEAEGAARGGAAPQPDVAASEPPTAQEADRGDREPRDAPGLEECGPA